MGHRGAEEGGVTLPAGFQAKVPKEWHPLERPIVSLDLETTGLDTKTARIVEIGIIRLNVDGTTTDYHSTINPGIPIPAAATAKHGFTDDDVYDKPRLEDVAPKLVRAFNNADFIGYNIKYDLAVLEHEFKRVGVSTDVPAGTKPPRILDGLVIWQKMHPRTLGDAVQEFLGRAHDSAHSAKGDAQAAIEVVAAQLRRWPVLAEEGLDALHARQFPIPEGAIDLKGKVTWDGAQAVLTFGKHQGLPLKLVPKSYLTWFKTQDMAFDLRVIIDAAIRGEYPKGPRA